ncbi:MAG: hypothetical protein AAF587_20495 [Bacteroidota bacterium]
MKTLENQFAKETGEELFTDSFEESMQATPDYTSMKHAILAIADPVPFESLKKFYGLS